VSEWGLNYDLFLLAIVSLSEGIAVNISYPTKNKNSIEMRGRRKKVGVIVRVKKDVDL
jgi:hypothetical protein